MEPLPPHVAETIYLGGRIYTLDEARPLASVLAVRGQELVYVGSEASEAESRLSRAARKVDLGGQVVVPGLLDGHAHVATQIHSPGAPGQPGLGLGL